MHPVIEYEFYRHCNKKIDNKFLNIIVKNLSKGVNKKTRREIEKKNVKTDAKTSKSILITWALQHRKEKAGNVTSMLISLFKYQSELEEWKHYHIEKEEELNEVLESLGLPHVSLDYDYKKNYFEIKDMLSQ